MVNEKFKRKKLAAAVAAAVGGTSFSGYAIGAQATAQVSIGLAVTAPTCTVTNSNSNIILPAASSSSLTVGQWIATTAQLNIAGAFGGSWVTSAALNQTARIDCNAQTVTVTSIGVLPGASAKIVSGNPAYQQLADSTNSAIANGDLTMVFEQVSINGAAATTAYATPTGQTLFYTTAFNTVSLSASSSTATVVWRPQFFPINTSSAFGNPTGGSFSGSASIVINY